MDIKELEFIRDFAGDLDILTDDLSDFCCAIEGEEFQAKDENHLWAISHQANLLKKILIDFKDKVDRKYWSEWKRANPHIHEDFDTHNKELGA